MGAIQNQCSKSKVAASSCSDGASVTLLIDECAYIPGGHDLRANHEAHHVVYLGMQGWKDHDMLRRVRERD